MRSETSESNLISWLTKRKAESPVPVFQENGPKKRLFTDLPLTEVNEGLLFR